jgi:acyl-coenzyme A thioesterase PaaI-like protein
MPGSPVLAQWQRLAALPGGKRLFSRLISLRAPYFASIAARFETLEYARAVVHLGKRRRVLNHIGSVHAIAMCNMAELAAGVLTEASLPATHRWIPKGMTVEYLRRADTDLDATASFDPGTVFGGPAELPVQVEVCDTSGQVVMRAVISMWITPRKKS